MAGTWSSPATPITLTPITVAFWNVNARDNLNYLRGLLPDPAASGQIHESTGTSGAQWTTPTITDSTAPSADAAAFNTLLSNLANRLNASSGAANWKNNPVSNIALLKAAVDAINAAGYIPQATADGRYWRLDVAVSSTGNVTLTGSATLSKGGQLVQNVAETDARYFRLDTAVGNSLGVGSLTKGGVTVLNQTEGDARWASISSAAAPSDVVFFWVHDAASIPAGYSSYSSLVDRVPIGAGSTYTVGGTGGTTSHGHTVNSHTHPTGTLAATLSGSTGNDSNFDAAVNLQHAGGDHVALTHQHPVGTLSASMSGATGGANPATDSISHLPPYLALTPIRKT